MDAHIAKEFQSVVIEAAQLGNGPKALQSVEDARRAIRAEAPSGLREDHEAIGDHEEREKLYRSNLQFELTARFNSLAGQITDLVSRNQEPSYSQSGRYERSRFMALHAPLNDPYPYGAIKLGYEYSTSESLQRLHGGNRLSVARSKFNAFGEYVIGIYVHWLHADRHDVVNEGKVFAKEEVGIAATIVHSTEHLIDIGKELELIEQSLGVRTLSWAADGYRAEIQTC